MGKQTVMTTMMPALTATQDAALLWLEAKREADDKKEAQNKRLDELIASMNKHKKDRVIVVDDDGWKHTFEIELGNPKVRHSQLLEKQTSKAADDLRA